MNDEPKEEKEPKKDKVVDVVDYMGLAKQQSLREKLTEDYSNGGANYDSQGNVRWV